MLGYLGSFSGYFFFEKPVTHIFHNFSVDLGALEVHVNSPYVSTDGLHTT